MPSLCTIPKLVWKCGDAVQETTKRDISLLHGLIDAESIIAETALVSWMNRDPDYRRSRAFVDVGLDLSAVQTLYHRVGNGTAFPADKFK